MTGTLMSQYGSPEKREAFVYKNRKGFYVDLFRSGEYVRTVEVYDHSESYAEDVAENWVLRVLNQEERWIYF